MTLSHLNMKKAGKLVNIYLPALNLRKNIYKLVKNICFG